LTSTTNQEIIKIMTLKNALTYFKSLVTETNKKSEIKVFQEFIQLLSNLEKRNLSEAEIQSIETELDVLDLNPTTTNNKKHFSKALKHFKVYLKETLSLTPKGYYAQLYGGLGLSFGLLFGVIFLSSFERSLGISMGLLIGMLIGQIIGRNMDSQAKYSGTMIE